MTTYTYRIELEDVTIYRDMTPNKAAWYAALHDVIVEPVNGAPIAPAGTFEQSYSLADERPRRA